MKKRISILLLVAIATILFAACGAAGYDNNSGGETAKYLNSSAGGSADFAMPAPEAPMADASYMYESYNDEAEYNYAADYDRSAGNYSTFGGGSSTGTGSSIVPVSANTNEGLAEKIIYSVHANIETLEFDESIAKVRAMLTTYNAFIETSNVSGVNYESRFHGWNEHRYAYFQIRVPVGNLNAMTENLSTLGNVTHTSNDAMNISTQFYDTQSRLTSLNIQEERLLDMLKKAEDVPDLIMIEERLSEVRYQIEMLTTTLTGWQRQVDYSTVSLSLREVEEFTEQPTFNPSYWEQISEGFIATISGIGQFFMDVFKWLIVSAPVLIIIAVLLIAAVIIIRKKIKNNKAGFSELNTTYEAQPAETENNQE